MAVLDSLYPESSGERLPVIAEAVPGWLFPDTPLPAEVRWVREQTPTVDSALVAAVVTRGPAGLRVQDALGARPDLTWVDSAAYQRDDDRTAETGLIRSAVELSPVALSPDSARALVHVSLRCGGLCGHSKYVVLERTDWRGWNVTRVLTRVVR
jgi:hypothetical protein